jgi:outer membrane protein assembly factor BamB
VFLTTATDNGVSCRVLCFDRASGKKRWDKEVYRQKPLRKEARNSYATSTPVTDGQRVYAVFSDGGIVALDYEGKIVWINRDVHFYSQHGLGTSPLLYGDLLILAFDGSSSTGDKTVGWQKPWDKSFLLALDKSTGKERWRAHRGLSRIAHTSPMIMKVAGSDQIISNAGDVVQGFDPASGERLWSVRSEGEGVVPSPVCGAGLVFTTSGFGSPTICATRPGNGKDKAAIVWSAKHSVPMIPSLLYVRPYLFAISQDGFAQCLEAISGKRLWRERVGGSFSASPICAEGKIYLLSDSGETTILEAASRFKVVARNRLEERCQASLAVSEGQLFLRTEKHLLCIGSPLSRR